VKTARFSIIALFLFGCSIASACSVPVFRYALNYWEADRYELQANGTKLAPDLTANVIVKPAEGDAARLVLGDQQIWSGELTPDVLEKMLDSPVRREIVRRIIHGDSVVWVLVESGDAAANDAAAKFLTERLRYLESIAVVPELLPNDPFNKIGPGPALTLRHSVLRMSARDPEEAFTLAMLERGEADSHVPTAYPVFGRGRVLIALPQEKLTTDNIDEVCGFLTGQCSCEVKDSRMGWDLLLKCDWDEELAQADQRRQTEGDAPQKARPVDAGPTSQPVVDSHPEPQTVIFHGQASIDPLPPRLPWLTNKLAVATISLVLTGLVGALWLRKRA